MGAFEVTVISAHPFNASVSSGLLRVGLTVGRIHQVLLGHFGESLAPGLYLLSPAGSPGQWEAVKSQESA